MLVVVSRVEWTRLDGDDVEAVVAMFVNRERPDSVRITPSRGDGGVDILDRSAGPEGGDVVYQVKAYCEPLTTRQKTEIVGSLNALTTDPRWAELRVTAWHLVTPWDPTPEAELWLRDLAAGYGLTPVWHGLTYVEQLTAKYPDVVDYYLHGGRTRVEQAYQSVAALFGTDRGERLDIPSVAARVGSALSILDTDPHYRYELHFGAGDGPPLVSRPNLVLTWIMGRPSGGQWVAVDVLARCAASVQERPITLTGQFTVERDGEFHAALDDSAAFGTPFTSPPGAFEGNLDAPGGPGGPLPPGRIWSLPIDQASANRELHVQVLDPAGTTIAAVDVDRVERSQGAEGMRWVLEEVHHVFRIEDRYRPATSKLSRSLTFGDFTGQPVAGVLEALRFVNACRSPNAGRVSVRHTPPERGEIDPSWAFDPPEDVRRELAGWIRRIGVLATIQQHTSVLIRVPEPDHVSPDDIRQWIFVAQVLRGEAVAATYPDGHCLIAALPEEVDVPDDGPLGVAMPLAVNVSGQQVVVGRIEFWLDNPTLIDRTPRDGLIYHRFTTPDRSYRAYLAAE
jgi:hypothetical protein